MSKVYVRAELVDICFLFSFSHLIECWVICSSVLVVIFCYIPLLNLFPQQGSKAVLHHHSHLYTPQPSLCTAPVLAQLICFPVVFLLGNAGLPVAWFPLQSTVAISWCYFDILALPTLQGGLFDQTLQRVSRSTSHAVTAMDPVHMHVHF